MKISNLIKLTTSILIVAAVIGLVATHSPIHLVRATDFGLTDSIAKELILTKEKIAS